MAMLVVWVGFWSRDGGLPWIPKHQAKAKLLLWLTLAAQQAPSFLQLSEDVWSSDDQKAGVEGQNSAPPRIGRFRFPTKQRRANKGASRMFISRIIKMRSCLCGLIDGHVGRYESSWNWKAFITHDVGMGMRSQNHDPPVLRLGGTLVIPKILQQQTSMPWCSRSLLPSNSGFGAWHGKHFGHGKFPCPGFRH